MSRKHNDLVELIRIALKWKRSIILVTIIAAVGTAAFSWFFMPNYYKSSINFYPSNPIMTDRQVLYSTSTGEIEIDYFGSSSDVDRILTLANTSTIKDYIINKYHLMEHYGYDSTKEMSRYKTKKKFEKNYRPVETEFGAIEISVWDKDKELASEIANHIALTIDNHNKTMITRDKNVVIETFTNEIKYKEAFIDSLSSAIQAAKERGEKADKIVLMQSRLDSSAEDLNKSRRLLEQYATSASQNFSTIHITEAAYPAIRKDKPVRSLIVIGATLGAFLFMLILAIVVENYRKIKDSL
jgi:capsular polysaccharide biosynthesis protein